MATAEFRIVSGEDSSIHDEPHVEGRRITVRFIRTQVEERGLAPQTVADRYDLDLADVYQALAYYHDHPEEMSAVTADRERTIDAHADEALTGPEDR